MRLSISLNFTIELNGREVRLTRASWARRRKQVKQRDSAICQNCGVEAPDGHVDHILPLSRGGTDDLSNLAWYCQKCNLSKGDKTLAEWTTTQVEDKWQDKQQIEQQTELVRELTDQGLSDTAIAQQVYGYKNSRVLDQVRQIRDSSADETGG